MVWPTKKLGEVCDVSSGNSAPQGKKYFQGGKYPFFRTSDVGAVHLSENLCDVRDYLNDDGAKGLRIFRKGTVLFPKSGASTFLNHRVMMGFDGFVSSHLATISAGESVCDKYLYYFLTLVNARKIAPNSSYPSLKVASIADIEIPLPSITEQKKIVARVEKLLAKVKEANRLRAEARAAAQSLLSAELHKIFEEGNKKGWEDVFFGDQKYLQIIDGDRGKNYPTKLEFSQEGYCLFLSTSNVRNGNFNFSKMDFITKEKDESLRKGKVSRGDLILTTRGTLGNSAYYDNSIPYENIRINSGMVVLRTEKKKLLPQYLIYIINSDEFIIKTKEANSGSAQPQLPIKVLSKLAFLLPPLAEQKKIVARLDALSAKLKKIEEYQKSAESDLDRLEQSILHQAFARSAK